MISEQTLRDLSFVKLCVTVHVLVPCFWIDMIFGKSVLVFAIFLLAMSKYVNKTS